MRTIALLAVVSAMADVLAGPADNPVVNPSFETDEDGDGLADGWIYAPGTSSDKAPKVKVYRDSGKVGQWCQAVECTDFQRGHVMIAQVGTVAVEAGKQYELSFWARGEGLATVKVGLQDTRTWSHLGLWRSFRPTKRWRRFHFRFVANRSAHETTRLQFWFTSTGRLWIDEVVFEEVAEPAASEYIVTWPPGADNCLINASFELGKAGWATYGYWRLYGEVTDETALHGRRSLKIRTDPGRVPAAIFDYYEPTIQPLERLAATNRHWIALKTGDKYTFSGYARADRDAQLIIGVRFPRAEIPKTHTLPGDRKWHRFAITFAARDHLGYVYFGPLRSQSASGAATVWIDALQLEHGEQATDFTPRKGMEVVVETPVWRGGSDALPGLSLRFKAYNDHNYRASAWVQWRVTDFFGAQLGYATIPMEAPPRKAAEKTIKVAASEVAFARVEASVDGDPVPTLRSGAAVSRAAAEDSPFGINHAYPWDQWLTAARGIGIGWVRDWTLKWDWLEPRPGEMDVSKADPWVLRPSRLGMAALCMFPFPSAVWAAEEPPKQPAGARKLYRPIEIAFRPRDVSAFKKYVSACVRRYRRVVRHWEVFNESCFTSYSLPESYGYKADDYVPLLRAASEAIRAADERAFVIGGYSAPPTTLRRLYERMFALGGLKWCQAVSIHHYPGGEPEGIEDDLRAMVAMMRSAGRELPMWLTEFAYYADDDPCPARGPLRWPPLVESELDQALWTQRYCLLCLSSGVTHIFFHIWWPRDHFDSGAGLFFEEDGEPRKVAAATAALWRLLGPRPKPAGLYGGVDEGRYVAVFARGDGKSVAAIWDAWDQTRPTGPAPDGQWYDAVGQRLKRPPSKIGAAPVFVVASEKPARLSRAVRDWIGM